MLLAVGCASSSSSWDLLKCSWNVFQLCSCAGRLSHSQMSWVKTPAHCKMIIPILISCSLVARDFFCLCHQGVAGDLDPDLVYGLYGIVYEICTCFEFLVQCGWSDLSIACVNLIYNPI